MAAKNETAHQTPFTVTIEAREGVTTGISAADRAHTIRVAVDPEKGPEDIVKGGHVNPLKARPGGVLERTGHTEASIDLARLAGLRPGRRDLRGPERGRVDGPRRRPRAPTASSTGCRMITIADLIAYRRRHDKLDRARRGDDAAHRLRRLRGRRLPLADRRQAPRGAGQGRRRGRRGRARARALRVPDRRRLPLAALRLRRAARVGAGDDRARGPRRPPLPGPGGARHRAAQQAARLQAPGGGPRHRRRQPRARPARRPARLRHRRADPGRPRAELDPDPHQQPQEDPRPARATG